MILKADNPPPRGAGVTFVKTERVSRQIDCLLMLIDARLVRSIFIPTGEVSDILMTLGGN